MGHTDRSATRLLLPLLLVLMITLVLTGCGRSKPSPTMEFSAVQVDQGLEIRVEMTDFEVPRDGHVHIRINNGPEVMAFSNVYKIPELPPGTYEVWVNLSDLGHQDLELAKTKTVEIK